MIKKVFARQILDSRGNPTVEVDMYTEKGMVRAAVPSGASTGKLEAHELRDNKRAYNGKGVLKAVKNINKVLAPKLRRKHLNLYKIDDILKKADGTANKKKLGANALLACSIAAAKAEALQHDIPVYKLISKYTNKKPKIPIPAFNIINGGAHAGGGNEFQEYMVIPHKAKNFAQSLQMGSEINHALKEYVKKHWKYHPGIGDEGGIISSSKFQYNLTAIQHAIENAGYNRKVSIGIDAAASQFYDGKGYRFEGQYYTPDEFQEVYALLIEKYNIKSIEDPFDESDFHSFAALTKNFGSKCQIVGDDLLVTNPERIEHAIHDNACNALLLKVNQIGTVSEALTAGLRALKANWKVMVSHRSGETNDHFIADLAVGLGAQQIKSGAPVRGERLAKYNQLLRIEEDKVKLNSF